MEADSSQRPQAQELTVVEVARELGVHYMTAYRYIRIGKLPARKQGRDWRIARADLDRLASPTGPGDLADPAPGAAQWAKRFLNRLMAIDQQGAWAVIESALTSGLDPKDVYSEVIIPALQELGDRWEAGEVTVAEEHATTNVCQRMVGRLGPRVARRGISKGTIVLGCAPSELHGLAAAIAADTMRAAGYDVIDCGPDVPPDSLATLSSNAPRLVATAVSATSRGNEAAIAQAIGALRSRVDVPIILGGRAVESGALAREFGADIWAASAAEGVARLHDALHGAQR